MSVNGNDFSTYIDVNRFSSTDTTITITAGSTFTSGSFTGISGKIGKTTIFSGTTWRGDWLTWPPQDPAEHLFIRRTEQARQHSDNPDDACEICHHSQEEHKSFVIVDPLDGLLECA